MRKNQRILCNLCIAIFFYVFVALDVILDDRKKFMYYLKERTLAQCNVLNKSKQNLICNEDPTD